MFPTIISENLISKNDCELILEFVKNKTFNDIPQNYNLPKDPTEDIARIKTISIDSSFEGYKILSDLDKSLINFIKNFYGLNVLNLNGQCIVRYNKDQYIGYHKDWEPKDPYVIENKKPQVHLSSVTYINGNFVGGEIILKSKDESNFDLITIKPDYGTTVFFSGDKYHLTKPIINGTKYSYTNFYTLDI